MVQTYREYLSEIEFEVIDINNIKEEMLYELDNKNGYVIENEYDIYVCKKFEPVEFLNQVIIMEKINEFYVIDMLGVIMYEDKADGVIEFVKGFLLGDE